MNQIIIGGTIIEEDDRQNGLYKIDKVNIKAGLMNQRNKTYRGTLNSFGNESKSNYFDNKTYDQLT